MKQTQHGQQNNPYEDPGRSLWFVKRFVVLYWYSIDPGATMNLTGLHLLLTYRCTYECDHCFVHSSPRTGATMPLELALSSIRQANKLGTVSEIYFEGGEPFLVYPVLVRAAKEARSFGMQVGIVSNGYFATTIEDAVEWLKPFAEMGGVAISFSDDGFHGREDESETPADRARAAAEKLGIDAGTICIDPPGIEEDPHQPGTPIVGGGVRFRGRAATSLVDESLPRQPWSSFCSCTDEDWVDLGRLHLDPYGRLYPCQGVSLGNLNEKPLTTILEEYDPDTHPIIGPLMRGGPAELVRAHGLTLRGDWIDGCQLCYNARKALRDLFPDELGPGEVYGEMDG